MNIIDELKNWRAAHNDRWLDRHLDIEPPPIFEQYQSGKAFDEPDDWHGEPDQRMAELTEGIVVKIGTVDLDIYEAMVGFWPYARSYERIAQDMHKSVPYVKACLRSGERMYGIMRKKWK